jgi:antitoxin component of MazEF toxin-antitoxin module
MTTQTIFQAGNSSVVAIPSQYMTDMNMATGHKIFVDKIDNDTLVIRKVNSKKINKKSDAAFQKWLSGFMAENAEILDELADR